jgi:2-(1,2-epoxy-1,2-dihydrophenyl)acetyl-CoA isomerase
VTDIIKFEELGAVARITLNRPASMNAFTTELRAGLVEALQRAGESDGIRAVVLTGEGRCFSAGADLKEVSFDRPISDILQAEYRPVQEQIAGMAKPVIAAVPGSAAGIGLSIALQCDLLIMADNAFQLSPFTTISLVPDGGLNWLLVRQLGYRRAFQLSVESERIDAARCVELGLANKAVSGAGRRVAACGAGVGRKTGGQGAPLACGYQEGHAARGGSRLVEHLRHRGHAAG